MLRDPLFHVAVCFLWVLRARALPLPASYWCSDSSVSWADCGKIGAEKRMMEELPGIITQMPAWWESMPVYTRQCPSCTPIWLLCPSEDTGGWDGGDTLRIGGMMMMEIINKQQWFLPGYELMCDYYNDACTGIRANQVVTSRTMAQSSMQYVAIGQTGCSGAAGTVATYTPVYNMPTMSWAAGMPDLTNRVTYPNFFRTRIPHTAFTYAWLKMAQICDWTNFVVVLAEEARFRGHFELMKREIVAAGGTVALEGQILQPLAQADAFMQTVLQKRLRIMQMVTYETTWRALMCSARQLGMKGLVWLVYGFYNTGFYGILNNPDLTQWSCDKAALREAAHQAIFATSTMWAPMPDVPITCDKDGAMTTTQFKAEYLTRTALLSTDDMIARGGRNYKVNAPRDAGAQAADGACIYAMVLSAMMGLSPQGTTPFSGNTYTFSDLLNRGADVYEDMNQLLQSVSFMGVSGSPFTFACSNMPSNKQCDATCRNDLGCTGDANGAAIVFQFDKDGTEGVSDRLATDSEYPRTLIYDRGVEQAATTDAQKELAYDWNSPLLFPWGGYWGGDAASAPTVPTTPGDGGAPCVVGYHVVSGTAYCVPDDHFPSCLPGTVLQGEFCAPCPAQTYYDADLGNCLNCPLGSSQDLPGQDSCVKCEKGTFSNTTPSQCVPCAAGTFAEDRGMEQCVKCPKGAATNMTGQQQCARCEQGSFADEVGSAQCTPCGDTFSTQGPGATSSSDCKCPAGSYEPAGGGSCIACSVGLDCLFGADASIFPANGGTGVGNTPLVQAGYFTTADDPMSVWECSDPDWCPGGGSAACHGIRTGLGCAMCPEGYFGQDCDECDSAIWVPVVFGCALLGFGAVALIAIDGAKDLLEESEGRLMVGMVAGILCEAVQLIAAVGELSLIFTDPMYSFLNSFAIAQFDIKLLQSECVHGNDPITTYISAQMGAPFIVPMVLGGLLMKKLYYGNKMPLDKVHIVAPWVNGIGVFWSEFFLAIVILAVAPFVCFPHPNGSKTVTEYPAVLCFEGGDHAGLIVCAILAVILIPIPFMSFVIFATWKFPAMIVKMGYESVLFLRATRFLFVDVVPPAYIFPAALLFRNFAVAIVPVLSGGDAAIQVLGISVVLLVFRGFEERANPFRIAWCTTFDLMAQSVILFILFCGTLTTEFDPDMNRLKALMGTVIGTVIIAFGIPLVYTMYHKLGFHRTKSNHDLVLVHNKVNAAAQCLLLKHFIETATGQHVFLDNSSVLAGMDTYLEAIRVRPEKVIAYLTARIIELPTFISEMVLAFYYNLNVMTVKTPSFIAPSEQQMQDLEQHIDTTGCFLLYYGVTLEKARDSLERLFSPKTTCVELDDSLDSVDRIKDVACKLLPDVQGPAMTKSPLPDGVGLVFVSAEPRSDEAVAAAHYIRLGLLNDMEDCYCLTDYTEDVNLKSEVLVKSRAVIVILSESSLESTEQITVMVNAMHAQADAEKKGGAALALIPVALPTFRFPSSHRFYDEIVGHIFLGHGTGFIRDLVLTLGHLRTVSFPLHQSTADLHHYIDVIRTMVPATIDLVEAAKRRKVNARVSVGPNEDEAKDLSVGEPQLDSTAV